MTDYKELCAELVTELEGWCGTGTYDNTVNAHSVIDRARAALAYSESEEPSKAELRQIFDDQSGYINDEQVMWWSDFQSAARAVLARWGNL